MRICEQSWEKNMPIILWLLGVPLIVVIALMVAHVI
jgi:heme/copper-type cytochrome/quinol oxidase subunit 2